MPSAAAVDAMDQQQREEWPDTSRIMSSKDLILARTHARDLAIRAGFRLHEATAISTAASELMRNMLEHANGGEFRVELTAEPRSLRMTAKDEGPGIGDINAALRDGYSTTNGLGLGLSVVRRAMDHVSIDSAPGEGTTIIAERWLPDPSHRGACRRRSPNDPARSA